MSPGAKSQVGVWNKIPPPCKEIDILELFLHAWDTGNQKKRDAGEGLERKHWTNVAGARGPRRDRTHEKCLWSG